MTPPARRIGRGAHLQKSRASNRARDRAPPYRGGPEHRLHTSPDEIVPGLKVQHLVQMIAARGATDTEIEQIYGWPRGQLKDWKARYPSLAESIAKGRSVADANVLYAMYRNAVGYDFIEQQAVGGRFPEVMEVRRHARPETSAQRLWLTNRQREHWRDTVRAEVGGFAGAPAIPVETRNSIIDSILGLVQPKADNEKSTKEQPPKDGRRTR